jgi:hypothetical protein
MELTCSGFELMFGDSIEAALGPEKSTELIRDSSRPGTGYMSSIADIITTLEQGLLRIRGIDACLRQASDAWADATNLLRTALEGSQDPDAEVLLAHCAATEQAFTQQSQLLVAVATTVEGVIRRLRGEPSAHQSRNAVPKALLFDSSDWLARVGRSIDPKTTKVTTGIGFDPAGNESVRLTSGRDDLALTAQERLSSSRQYPKPPGWRPGMLFAAAEHAETKHAVWMRTHGVTHTTVVINHPRVCGPPYGCEVAVRTILPRGWTMTVISSVTGQRWTLRGVSEE